MQCELLLHARCEIRTWRHAACGMRARAWGQRWHTMEAVAGAAWAKVDLRPGHPAKGHGGWHVAWDALGFVLSIVQGQGRSLPLPFPLGSVLACCSVSSLTVPAAHTLQDAGTGAQRAGAGGRL